MFHNHTELPEYLVYVSDTCKKLYFSIESKTWFFCLKIIWGRVRIMIILQGEMFLQYTSHHAYQIFPNFPFLALYLNESASCPQ